MKIAGLVLPNPLILAPMAGVTNLPFRAIVRSFGCGLAFTEMVSATGLARRMARSLRYLETTPEDRPLGVQLFGSDPAVLAEAARIVTDRGADVIDINMGCPVRKVVKTGAGAALMKEPRKAAMILEAVRAATPLPLTAKMRSGWRRASPNAVAIARIAEEAGVDAVTIHPRGADQGYGGAADWECIAEVKAAVRIPVVGNGDLRSPADVARMARKTGCDAWMIGRAALGNPWIFREILAFFTDGRSVPAPSPAEREALIRWHLDREMAFFGGRSGLRSFRKHLLWYTKGLRGGAAFRAQAGAEEDRDRLLALLHAFLASPDLPGDGGEDEKTTA